ncbi:hypothetical protein LJR230_002227 [Trinickia sp. LjRoot230]|uniref:hypothetical protein n=1 Tax=Trinickia sp. LjRoot230 TaxID=3342288 RepID=UPI003ECF311D
MSILAEDLIALLGLPAPRGTLTEHLLREIAGLLIARGVDGADEFGHERCAQETRDAFVSI